MATPKIRKTADNTAAGVRTFSWEIYDAEDPVTVLSSGTSAQTAATVTNHVLREIFENLLIEYCDLNGFTDPPGGTWPAVIPLETVADLVTVLDEKELLADKGAANGYAELDAGGKVPAAQLPAGGAGDMLKSENLSGLGSYVTARTNLGLGTAAVTAATAYATAAQGATADSASQPGHTHTGVYEPANANIQAHVASAHAPSNAQKNSDITKAEIEAKLTGAITSHTHSGGSDPWTTVLLGSDFPTTSATAVDITGLGFTPTLNTRYEFEGMLLLRTATTTVNPRAGLAWPTGMTDGVAQIIESQAATGAPLAASGNPNAALLIAVGGLLNTTQSWPATLKGTALAGATPSGNIRWQLASETAGTTVTAKAGSFIKYRTIP